MTDEIKYLRVERGKFDCLVNGKADVPGIIYLPRDVKYKGVQRGWLYNADTDSFAPPETT